jgi:hypothetical protein
MLRQKTAHVVRKPVQVPGIRVVPRDEQMRKLLVHPKGIRFRPTGSIEWPNDRFTQRRIADGSIKLAEHAHSAPPHDQSSHKSHKRKAEDDAD